MQDHDASDSGAPDAPDCPAAVAPDKDTVDDHVESELWYDEERWQENVIKWESFAQKNTHAHNSWNRSITNDVVQLFRKFVTSVQVFLEALSNSCANAQ